MSRPNTLRLHLGMLGLISVSSTWASTLVVTDLGDSVTNLVCDAQCTLREALVSAQAGDTITWSQSLPFPATTLLAQGSGGLLIDKNLTILGPGAQKLTIDAQNQSRVLTVTAPATVVTIDGLALAHGRIQGADGYTPCDAAPDGSVTCQPGTNGEGVAGGCIHVSQAQMTFSGVDIHDCALFGGRGGAGGSNNMPNTAAANGTYGGDGGAVSGGGIYSTGPITLIDTSIHAIYVTAGNGGTGGFSTLDDGYPELQSYPGNGGHGGVVMGAALHSIAGATLRNVTIVADSAVSGTGGNGGTAYAAGMVPYGYGSGGYGGSIYGGIWYWRGTSRASFSTFRAAYYDLGSRGGGGGSNEGLFIGRFVQIGDLNSPLTLAKSVFSASTPSDPIAPTSYCDSGASSITVSNSFASHGCGSAVVADPLLDAPSIGVLGLLTLPPTGSSPIVDAATDCLDADGQAVSHDANSNPRPQLGGCDIGAHELGRELFAHGFE